MIAKFKYIICAFCVIFSVAACVDNDDDVPMNYYTSTKLTAAGLLEENPEQFSDFIAILKRTPYFSLLSWTCLSESPFRTFSGLACAIDSFEFRIGLQIYN